MIARGKKHKPHKHTTVGGERGVSLSKRPCRISAITPRNMHTRQSIERRIVLLFTMANQFSIRHAEREPHYARHRRIDLAFPELASVYVSVNSNSIGRRTHKYIRHFSVLPRYCIQHWLDLVCPDLAPRSRGWRFGVWGAAAAATPVLRGRLVVGCSCGAGSSIDCVVGALPTPTAFLTIDYHRRRSRRRCRRRGSRCRCIGVGVGSIFHRFGLLLPFAFSTLSPSLPCLRTDDLIAMEDNRDESDPVQTPVWERGCGSMH
ncbi:hypothetical protein EI94DRAFT_1094504 [Lactarius quietus]|nr:hypothetical protein EI94DRAFT_1094504 [Lactarius quietus]